MNELAQGGNASEVLMVIVNERRRVSWRTQVLKCRTGSRNPRADGDSSVLARLISATGPMSAASHLLTSITLREGSRRRSNNCWQVSSASGSPTIRRKTHLKLKKLLSPLNPNRAAKIEVLMLELLQPIAVVEHVRSHTRACYLLDALRCTCQPY